MMKVALSFISGVLCTLLLAAGVLQHQTSAREDEEEPRWLNIPIREYWYPGQSPESMIEQLRSVVKAADELVLRPDRPLWKEVLEILHHQNFALYGRQYMVLRDGLLPLGFWLPYPLAKPIGNHVARIPGGLPENHVMLTLKNEWASSGNGKALQYEVALGGDFVRYRYQYDRLPRKEGRLEYDNRILGGNLSVEGDGLYVIHDRKITKYDLGKDGTEAPTIVHIDRGATWVKVYQPALRITSTFPIGFAPEE